MDADMIIGLVVLAAVLCLMAVLVLWGRRTINRIASRGFASARQIARDERRGR